MGIWKAVKEARQVEKRMKTSQPAVTESLSEGDSVEIIVSCSDSEDESEQNRNLRAVGDQTQQKRRLEENLQNCMKHMVPALGSDERNPDGCLVEHCLHFIEETRECT